MVEEEVLLQNEETLIRLIEDFRNSPMRVGEFKYRQKHTSGEGRYDIIHRCLNEDRTFSEIFRQNTWIKDDLESFRTKDGLVINDYSCGQFQAGYDLMENLLSHGNKFTLNYFDLINPEEIIDKEIQFEIDSYNTRYLHNHILNGGSRDVATKADADHIADIGIIGYVHPYISSKQFKLAIEERLKECNWLFIIPGGNDNLGLITGKLVKATQTGEIKYINFRSTL